MRNEVDEILDRCWKEYELTKQREGWPEKSSEAVEKARERYFLASKLRAMQGEIYWLKEQIRRYDEEHGEVG